MYWPRAWGEFLHFDSLPYATLFHEQSLYVMQAVACKSYSSLRSTRICRRGNIVTVNCHIGVKTRHERMTRADSRFYLPSQKPAPHLVFILHDAWQVKILVFHISLSTLGRRRDQYGRREGLEAFRKIIHIATHAANRWKSNACNSSWWKAPYIQIMMGTL